MTSALVSSFRLAACRGSLARHCARGALGIARTAHGTDRSFFAAGWMPLPSRSRGLSVSRRDADIPPRKEHAMKEPPPRKRGRKSRRAAAAADLVPDEPFEDVRARARQEGAISNECFSCGVAVPQLARKCLEHVISAVCTPVSPPFRRPPAHCCPLRQVEPLREYNDHFETTLTGEARARARGCIARTCDLHPADEEATIDLGQTVGFFRLLMDKDRSVLDLTAPVSGAQTYKFGASQTSPLLHSRLRRQR